IDVRRTTTIGIAWRTDDHIVVAISVDVTNPGDVPSKVVGRRLGGHGYEDGTVLARVDVRLADAGRARHDIRNAVVIGVARRLDADTQLIAWLSIDAPQQLARLDRIHIDAARFLAVSRSGRHEIEISDGPCDPAELIVRRFAIPFPDDLHPLDERIG